MGFSPGPGQGSASDKSSHLQPQSSKGHSPHIAGQKGLHTSSIAENRLKDPPLSDKLHERRQSSVGASTSERVHSSSQAGAKCSQTGNLEIQKSL